MELPADEVLATLRELHPRELQIAMLTVANRRLASRIAELEEMRDGKRPDEVPE